MEAFFSAESYLSMRALFRLAVDDAGGVIQQALGCGLQERFELVLELGRLLQINPRGTGFGAQLVIVQASVEAFGVNQNPLGRNDGHGLIATGRLDHTNAAVALGQVKQRVGRDSR